MSAIANYMFLICRHDMTITLPSRNPTIKFRKLKDLTGNGEYCNERKPLLNVELNHIIPDELHLMLRITDVLIEALISTVIAYDRQEHQRQQIHSRHRTQARRVAFKVLQGAMLQNLITVINTCGVQFHVWQDKGDESLSWTSLMGGDKLKLLKGLPDKLESCHPADMVSDVMSLWKVPKLLYMTFIATL